MLTRSGIKIPKLVRFIFSVEIIFLLIMSLLRMLLFLVFSRQGNHFAGVLSSFLLGLRYDLRYAGILGALLLIMGSFAPLDPFLKGAGRKLVLFFTGLAAFLVVFFYSVDFAHYSYLSQRLNASVLNYLVDTRISLGMAWQTYPIFRIILLLIAGTWLIQRLVRLAYGRIRKAEAPVLARKNRIGWFVVLFLLLGLAIFGRIGQYPLRWSDAFSLGSDYKANLALNPFQSFFSSLKFRKSVYDEAKVKEDLPLLAPYFGFNGVGSNSGATAGIRTAGVSGGPAMVPDSLANAFARMISPRGGALTSRPNVVVVICESFSGYKSSMWGNPLNTTPFFNSMCQKGIFFDHCFTPSYGTARGVWALITGIPDVEVSTTTSSRNPSAVDQHTIINNFEGYDKFYFLGGSTSWANIRGLLTNNIKGLHLYEQQDYTAPKVDVWGISDKNLFLEANKVLKQQTSPFFAIIQTADNHRPYTIPEEDRQAFHSVSVLKDSLRKCGFESNEEMNAFRYTDFGYQTFIEAASREKYFANTVFLFIGDHGIPGDAGAMFPRAWTDQRLTAEHVPLLIYSPALLAPERISTNCSQVDVLPTLAGLCNLPYRNTTLGRDLLDTARYNGKALSFIYDPDQGIIGVVRDGYFYRRQLKTGKEEMVSVVGNDPVPDAVEKGPLKKELRQLSDGVYETAKYMLLKNKKN
ncbi:MAG TPA: sulfatase-like hydrolase/transferase [Puia sp.]|nr:sulfatase-like hydrolase/transferase [Puia sp.]